MAKLNPAGSALVYSTYLGGSSGDGGNGIAVDSSGNAYVTGYTNSTNFPTANPLQAVYGGCGDAFVAKLNPGGSALVYSTYLGGSSDDRGYGIAVDSSGNAYVTGYTDSTNFPTANPLQAFSGGFYDAFVTKIGVGVSAPSCQLTSIVNGPPKQLIVTMQDAASGLQTIQLAAEVNATVSIPSFTVGATTPVIVTATKVDQSQTSEVSFTRHEHCGQDYQLRSGRLYGADRKPDGDSRVSQPEQFRTLRPDRQRKAGLAPHSFSCERDSSAGIAPRGRRNSRPRYRVGHAGGSE